MIVDPGGAKFGLVVGGTEWFKSAPTFLQAGRGAHTSRDPAGGGHGAGAGASPSQLRLVNFTGPSHGVDPVLGTFTRYDWEWAAVTGTAAAPATLEMLTSAKVFDDHPTVLFTQAFPGGVGDFGFGKLGAATWGTPATGWPSLQRSDALPGPLEYVTFVGDGDVVFGPGLGTAAGFQAGAAVGYFNATGHTVVVSSASSFLSSVMGGGPRGRGPGDSVLRCGVQGTATSLPVGYSTSFVVHAGAGVPETFMAWGDQLLAMHSKPRASANASVSLQYLGYSTTGSYFYAHRKNESYQETMLAVRDHARAAGIPYRYFIIDSWW